MPEWPSDPIAREVTLVLVLATAAILFHHYAFRGRVQQGRWAGLVVFGLPSLLIRPEAFAVPHAAWAAGFLGLVLVVLMPVVALAARSPRHREAYPEDRRPSWDRRGELANAAGWAAYLVGYEAFFRGLLLLTLARAYGPWPALALMTAIYAAQHLPRPPGEGLGTLPMGFVFGLATLTSGSVWPAIVGHIVIAVTSDTVAIRGGRAAPSSPGGAG